MMKKQTIALCAALLALSAVPAGAQEVKNELYTVVDGTKVDASTLSGFKTWRSAACDRCHGANQEGSVGPSLIDSLKKLGKDEFVQVVMEGRLDRGMPSFKENKQVAESVDKLYAYLKGRSNGDIKKAKVEGLQ